MSMTVSAAASFWVSRSFSWRSRARSCSPAARAGRPPTLGGEGRKQTVIPLLAPVLEVRGVEPFPAQQRAELPGLAGVGLPQDTYLVGRRELPAPRVFDHFGIRRGGLRIHRGNDDSPIGRCHGFWLLLCLPSTLITKPSVSHSLLAERARSA